MRTAPLKSASGIPLEPHYGRDSPGEFPFRRGIHKEMYRTRLWTMRQYSGFGSAEQTNKRWRFLISEGQTGLSLAFDLPTQLGYDSDSPLCKGEVGRVGVAIDTLDDMERLFSGIDISEVSTSMTINATAPILLAMYIAMAEKQGKDLRKLRGTIQNDILKEYFARGTYIFPPKGSMRLVTDIFSYCSKEMPQFNTISVSGYHAREAGCDAVQELAFTFGDAIEYVEAAIRAGLDVDSFADRMSFFFSVDNDFFEEIAKFRAARMIWAGIMRDRFKAKSQKAQMLRFHCQTSGASLASHEPDNNISRVTLQALAAVLGGCQSLHTNSKDEALSLPTEESVKTALRTQQIIAEETGIPSIADPLGGSGYIEHLTDEINTRTEAMLKDISRRGGMIRCIESGYVQQQIQAKAYEAQKRFESQERVVVGVNKYRGEQVRIPTFRMDPSIESDQVARLSRIKDSRDLVKVHKALSSLRKSASRNQEIMPMIIESVKSNATIQEISDILRDVFGEYNSGIL